LREKQFWKWVWSPKDLEERAVAKKNGKINRCEQEKLYS
jgi:hypothetical protein